MTDKERSEDGKGAHSLAWYAQYEPDTLTLGDHRRLRAEKEKPKR